MEDKFTKLAGLCLLNDIGFYIQFAHVENCWWGWITSSSPCEEKQFRRHSNLIDLLGAMIDHVEGKK